MAAGNVAHRRPARRRVLAVLGTVVVVALLVAVLGPRVVPAVHPAALPSVPRHPAALQRWVDVREAAVAGLRPGSRARIVWADPRNPGRTECALVYLHGFSASQGEGAPTHQRLAQAFGCNLYLPRMPGHGLQTADALRGVQAQQWLDAAAEALAVGKVIGRRVVLIGSSMGGALALQTAAAHPADVKALVLWSPLVRERDDQLQPLFWPWGAQLLLWSRNHGDPVLRHAVASPAWAEAIHIDGYRAIAALTRGGMQAPMYARVGMPVFVGYYYRDEMHQDGTVSVAAMRAMFAQLATPAAQRAMVNFPAADNHVIASPLRSNAAPAVFAESCRFLAGPGGLPVVGGAQRCTTGWRDAMAQPAAAAALTATR